MLLETSVSKQLHWEYLIKDKSYCSCFLCNFSETSKPKTTVTIAIVNSISVVCLERNPCSESVGFDAAREEGLTKKVAIVINPIVAVLEKFLMRELNRKELVVFIAR